MNEHKEIAARHRRTRKDHATETAEDYVEAVSEIIETNGSCRVVDLTKRFDVSHVTVTRIISRLQKEGYVTTEPYRPIELTKSGEALAETSRKRHETVFNFLVALGVPEEIAEIDTEGIEHHVSEKTLKIFQKFVSQSQTK
ncbi:manganese-binding transcriptional regulator MntR [Thalassoglobus polymorphus]|uniref:Transcriptional regulator MntR n=1 Tax=Thalassoglobus polymorphus TaxID=2527994 RepID=A0A517QGS2_9PLAN|nr:manganese-binding transcriptional regulator MntR [Thalassoglobus polymorphus]QDT30839.1 Transcriptional regulator MntR [Thalassoglobus polymorphus]